MFEFLNFFGEFLYRVWQGFGAWRYIFSTKYRRKVHEKWRNQPRSEIIFDCFGGIIGIVLTLVIVVTVVVLIVNQGKEDALG